MRVSNNRTKASISKPKNKKTDEIPASVISLSKSERIKSGYFYGNAIVI